jgi:hypothetical protein
MSGRRPSSTPAINKPAGSVPPVSCGMVTQKLRSVFCHCVVAGCLYLPGAAYSQAGPPFLTNDPGTPGNANWEINVASMQTNGRDVSSYQIPQFDFNFGVGDRIQLTYELPYVVQTSDRQRTQTGWSNGFVGVKWRFLDQGEDGWKLSTFPQVEVSSSQLARQKGIAGPGPRYLIPVQVARRVGPVDLDLEVGRYVAVNGPGERILGFVAGRSLTKRLELDAEYYDDRVSGGAQHTATFGLGGRFRLRPGFLALFMAGRSVNGLANGQPAFMGYFGLQILLSDYGRRLNTEE